MTVSDRDELLYHFFVLSPRRLKVKDIMGAIILGHNFLLILGDRNIFAFRISVYDGN